MRASLSQKHGFTLIELMIVVAIIGILAMVLVPKFVSFTERANIAKTATDLKQIAKGFDLFAVQNPGTNRGYPNDTHLVLPAGVSEYVNETVFLAETRLGGNYNWEGPDNYNYAGIAIGNPTVDDTVMEKLDAKLDNGDLTSGEFQKTANGRFTFLLWQK
jgi:prepilin-type N-terminal cleavage/methylation domain-containing protein